MAPLHKKIMRVLRRQFGDVEDALDDVPTTGRVIGVVISPAFEGTDHSARQRRLWTALEGELSPEELHLIGPIATLTPAEASVKAE